MEALRVDAEQRAHLADELREEARLLLVGIQDFMSDLHRRRRYSC